MANEYFHRTPTSTGNRSVYTISVWIKKQGVAKSLLDLSFLGSGDGTTYGIAGTGAFGSTYNNRAFVRNGGSNTGYFDRLFRDLGAWTNFVWSVDTTQSGGGNRIKLYVNGADVGELSADIALNTLTNINTTNIHSIGTFNLSAGPGYTSGYDTSANYSDYFFVDGQALTPDVFGFYKEGKGYESSGTTQATDFRPGQWVPKAPRTIKSEINRRGGFGVNGFYLPMNDSSNFGADFHCAPNSIITLKGEDLPQPRNGLPTTSDNYVSQLRSDPYAANLVLAVPGVNTQPTGSELVTNGTFDTNASGWTITDTGTLVIQSDGTVEVTRGTSAIVAYQDITTVVGTTYELSVDITAIAGSHGQIYVYSTNHSGSLDTNIGYSFYTGTYKGTFTADTTTTRIALYAHPSGSTSYDNVSVKETTIRDYSADIKGSGTNKTLTPVGTSGIRNNDTSGSAVNGYYGSAMRFGNDGTNGAGNTDVINVPDSDDFYFTGDVTMECWIYPKATPSTAACIFGQWLSGGGTDRNFQINFDTSNRVISYFNSSATNYNTGTSPALALNQWYHIVAEKHGSVFTLYVNGVAVGVNNNTPTAGNNSTVPFTIGSETDGSNAGDYGFDGHIQDVRVYKGVAKYKGGFDVPKPYTPAGIESWRQVSDICKNNFATLNPLSYQTTGTYGSSFPALTNGNLTYTHGQTGQWERSHSTMGVGEGKWYFEFEVVTRPVTGNSENWAVGLRESDSSSFYGETDAFEDLGDHVYWIDGGTAKIVSNQDRSAGSTSGITAVANGDIINIAFEKTATALKVWFGKNGTYFNSGNPATGSNPAVNHSTTSTFIIPAVAYYQYSGQEEPVATFNFGQNPTFSGTKTAGTNADSNGKGLFKYQPPAGYLALCEDNLPTPATADPGEHFKTVLWSGDSNSGRSITGVGFQPDLVWLKSRTNAASHRLSDSVRGVNKQLMTNTTEAEATFTTMLTSFDSDGFTLGDNVGINGSGYTNVAWCWKAGGPAVSNTDGSITSQVSVNQTAGFSIVSFTSTSSGNFTIGHGLGKTPKLIITKERGASNNWHVWHSGVMTTSSQFLMLNSTAALGSYSNVWGTSIPTSLVFGANVGSLVNASTASIAYCWSEIEGYSKFGTYTGNENADGPFVYCGFKPALLIVKRTDSTSSWGMYDSSRNSTNPWNKYLVADTSGAEGTATFGDFLSNGFKWRYTGAMNKSGATYIFMAFAESPFQTANAK